MIVVFLGRLQARNHLRLAHVVGGLAIVREGGLWVVTGAVAGAVELGADAIMVSNHGGRQLDGGRSPFDQLDEIVQTVGGQIEIILDGGIQRGTHVLKALALGATACSGGRMYLYALGAAGRLGVEKALNNFRTEIERDMKLMGVKTIKELNSSMVRYRKS